MCQENSVNDLFYNNISLVKCLVNKLNYEFYDKEDLYQVGLMGLHNATINYDKRKNVKFSTYAIYYILGEIKKELRENKLIRYSKKIYKIKKMIIDGKNIEEIVNEENVSKGFVLDVYCKSFEITKIEETEYDYIKDESKKLNIFMIAKECLDELLYKIIVYKYINRLSQSEIGEMIGCNQSKVCRLEKKALKILKEKIVNYK